MKSTETKIAWRTQAQFLGIVKGRGGRRVLGLSIAPLDDVKWLAAAIEGPAKDKEGRTPEIETFLGDHGHRMIGRFKTPTAAIAAAEAYGRAWAAGDTDAMVAACACGDIEAKPLRIRRPRA